MFEALRAGASGFLLKNAPPEELVHAVRVVAAGEALLAPSVTRRLIEEFARRPAPPRRGPPARGADRARAGRPAPAGERAEQRRDRRHGCSWARARSRPTSPTCWASSACATGCRRWSSPTRAAWSRRAGAEPGEPALEEPPLGIRVHQLERAAVGGAGLVLAAEPAQQLGAGRVQVVVAVEVERARRARARRRRPRPRRWRRPRSARTTGEPVTRASSPYRAASCGQSGGSSTCRTAIAACST